MNFVNVSRLFRTIVFSIAKCPPLAGTFLLLAAAQALGADSSGNWPQFRGPGALGFAGHPNLPDRWSTNENVAWKVEVPGRGWSSPIVWGDTDVFQAGPEYKLLHKNSLDEMCMATPAITGDRLLIRTLTKLYCISGEEHSAAASTHPGRGRLVLRVVAGAFRA